MVFLKEYRVKNIIKFIALIIAIAFFCIACNNNPPDDTKEQEPDDPKFGMTWAKVSNSTFGSNTINSVAWGNGVFVAVGENGKIAYSADGKSWTAASNTVFTGAINCVAWGNGTFMAGGEGGRMATSPDGISWTAVANTGFNSNAINGITWGSDKWVAVGRGRMAYSNADGTSWTGADSNTPFGYGQGSPNLWDVAQGNNRFVLVGAAGGQGHGTSLAHSTDGINTNWTDRDMGDLIAEALTGIVFGSNKFITVSLSSILYSSDGMEWSNTEEGSLGKLLKSVGFGNNKFIAVGSNDAILTSDNGTSWTALTNVSLNCHFNGITYGGGTWVAVGLNGAIAYSEEGTK